MGVNQPFKVRTNYLNNLLKVSSKYYKNLIYKKCVKNKCILKTIGKSNTFILKLKGNNTSRNKLL